jgi:copper(I)-binding protein
MARYPRSRTGIRSPEERSIMLRSLVPCGLAMALLAPFGHAQAHGTLEAPNPAAKAAVLPAPGPTATRAILAQTQKMPAHGGHGDATSFAVGDLVVENAWARESVTRTGAVYLTVRNGGDQDDRLTGVSAEVADKAMLHSSVMQDGVMRMSPVDAVEIPAGGEAVLEPGGLHVMLIGLKAPLEEGKSFALTLEFENVGEVEVMTMIEDIGHGAGGHGN